MKISIIIPAYNEENRIGDTLEKYSSFFDNTDLDYELLVVINNTRDKTEEVVRRIQKRYSRIRFLNIREKGKGNAITVGFKDALKRKPEILGFVDADMATKPDSFYRLIVNLKNYDGAIANRYDKNSVIIPEFTFRRMIVAHIFNFIVRTLFMLPYQDAQCGAKAFKRNVIESILKDISITQWAYDIDILYLIKKQRFKIYSCPTEWEDKEGSKIKIIESSLEMLLAVIQLRVLHSRFSSLLQPMKKPIGTIYKFIVNRRKKKL